MLDAQSPQQFPAPSSPGATIEGAAKASAQDRSKPGNVDILTDTQGVDFGPYLQALRSKIRTNWFAFIPADVAMKKGSLAIEVRTNGKVGNVKVHEGDFTLAEASTRAIRKRRFYPAQEDGKLVEDRVRIDVVFRLDGEQVQARVVVPDPASSDARK